MESTKIVFSDTDVKGFVNGFEDAMPTFYSVGDDVKANTPWCAPWTYTNDNEWYESELTPYEMGRKWADAVREEWLYYLQDEMDCDA